MSAALFRRRFVLFAAWRLLLILPLLPLAACAGPAYNIISFTNPALITINSSYQAASPYPSTNFVNLTSTNIVKVTVSIFGLSDVSTGGNNSGGGLDILLAGPVNASPSVNLMFDAGIYQQPVSNINLTIDDSASMLFSTSSAVTNATYQPSGSTNQEDSNPLETTNVLAGFLGTQLNGTWGLYIIYDDYFAPGSISGGWSLNFYFAVNSPTVTTLAATQVGGASATLNASVNPGGGATSVYFEWGADTNYGSFTGTNLLSNNLNNPQSVALSLNGLSPQTTYHFQAVAVNAAGTNFGGDQSFVTAAGNGAPTLVALFGNNAVPVLALSGSVGTNYLVQFATNLVAPISWTTFTNLTLSNAIQGISPIPASNQIEFFRAVQP